MPIRHFSVFPDALDYFAEIVDGGLDDIQELRFWRTDHQCHVECAPMSSELDLGVTSQSTNAAADRAAVGGEGSDANSESGLQIVHRLPKRLKRKEPPELLNIGFSADAPFMIDVILDGQDYGRDQAAATVDRDTTGYLLPSVRLLLRGLDDAEWSRLAAAGRDRDLITLSVCLIAGIHGGWSISQVRVVSIDAIRPVGQVEMPLT